MVCVKLWFCQERAILARLIGPLLLGFLLGLRHAVEADHVAAVAALATRSAAVADRVKLAGAWGLGHAGTVLVLGVIVLGLGLTLPPGLSRAFEGAVGVMLILLGLDVLRRLRAKRIHVHTHRHDDGRLHYHAHAHERSLVHEPEDHAHAHPVRLLPRALLVGSVHGLAGSAALVVLSLQMARSTPEAIAYLALFGLGSILGMCVLSLAIAIPLRRAPQRLGAGLHRLEGALGMLTVVLGTWIAVTSALEP